ncbi:MAG: hypothetical protein ACI9Z4_000473 [Polaribacter sp.]|jgi:hypothetical protein
MKQKILPQLFIIYLRYLIGFAFIFSSLVKIQGLRFTTDSGAENPINSAWHFFETLYQSGIYWRFLGIAQFITGSLLITQRCAKLGAILFLPIIANIFIITISYDFKGTPIITGLMLLSAMFLIYWDWYSLKVLFNMKPTNSDQKRLENDTIWMYLEFALIALTLIAKIVLNGQKIIYALLLIPIIGLAGLIIGYRRRKLYLN